MSTDILDVVVVGAGISGLAAAFHLLKKRPETKLAVLEAKERVGGRLEKKELRCANGSDTWDMGGQWVCRNQKDIMGLLSELGVEVFDQWDAGNKIMQRSDGVTIKYSSIHPPLSFLALLDLWWFINKIECLCKDVPCEDPSKCPHAAEWDGMTLETWKHQNAWTNEVKEVLDAVVGIVFGVTPSQMSFLYFLHYLHCAGGWSVLVDPHTKGHAQEWRIKGTAHQVTELLVDRIGREKVLVSHPVLSLKQENEQAVVNTSVGRSFHAKFVVLAVPPNMVGCMEFSPPLPYNKQRLLQNMPTSHLIKFVATYTTAFWRKADLSGHMARNTMRGCCETDPLAITFDGTSHQGSPALLGFITSYAAAKWSSANDEERKDAVLKSLQLFFGPEAGKPIDFFIKDWSKEMWNGGCPVNVIVPGAIFNYGDCLHEPFQRIHWAGTESATRWRGYMNGAVQAGKRAATEILSRLDQ